MIASTASNEAMTETAGPRTPAVSQVGVIPGGGLSSIRQRRQGVTPGRIVIVWPSEPITPPKIQGLLSFTAASLMR